MNFFDDAISAHINWKERLGAMVEARDPAQYDLSVADSRECELGQWIHGIGREFEHLESYHLLARVHTRFHQCAEAIMTTVGDGQWDRAEEMLEADSAFAESSAETIVAIGALRAEIESTRYTSSE